MTENGQWRATEARIRWTVIVQVLVIVLTLMFCGYQAGCN